MEVDLCLDLNIKRAENSIINSDILVSYMFFSARYIIHDGGDFEDTAHSIVDLTDDDIRRILKEVLTAAVDTAKFDYMK